MIGIYKIQSKIYPSRVYYGRTIDFIKRQKQHTSLLNKNKHHSIILQNHVNKHGIDDLCFQLIESCDKEDLEVKEQKYLDLNNFFNVSKSSLGGRGEKNITSIKKLPITERLIVLNELMLKGDTEAIIYYLRLRFGNPKKMTEKQRLSVIDAFSKLDLSIKNLKDK